MAPNLLLRIGNLPLVIKLNRYYRIFKKLKEVLSNVYNNKYNLGSSYSKVISNTIITKGSKLKNRISFSKPISNNTSIKSFIKLSAKDIKGITTKYLKILNFSLNLIEVIAKILYSPPSPAGWRRLDVASESDLEVRRAYRVKAILVPLISFKVYTLLRGFIILIKIGEILVGYKVIKGPNKLIKVNPYNINKEGLKYKVYKGNFMLSSISKVKLASIGLYLSRIRAAYNPYIAIIFIKVLSRIYLFTYKERVNLILGINKAKYYIYRDYIDFTFIKLTKTKKIYKAKRTIFNVFNSLVNNIKKISLGIGISLIKYFRDISLKGSYKIRFTLKGCLMLEVVMCFFYRIEGILN
ncbi:hypothetical protein LZ32DRAFT_617281 [Colletotrichum eremochloae]|nr:hypothetical protein LZ32DRAFT_617281 [Colletotrichum eremochloae]